MDLGKLWTAVQETAADIAAKAEETAVAAAKAVEADEAGGAPAARYRRSVSQYLQRVLGPQQTAAHAPRQENSR